MQTICRPVYVFDFCNKLNCDSLECFLFNRCWDAVLEFANMHTKVETEITRQDAHYYPCSHKESRTK